MKTHFDPYSDDDNKCPCGVYGTKVTVEWEKVTCARCLSMKEKLAKWHEETEAIIVKQMGDFAKWEKCKTHKT